MKRPYGLGTVASYGDVFQARAPRDVKGRRPVLGYCPTEEEANKLLEDVALLKAEAGLAGGATMTVKAYGPRFLDARESGGVRDMKSERSRWRLHCATAHFVEWPMQNVEKTDVRDWLTALGQKEAADVRVKDGKERAQRTYLRKPRKLGAQSRKHCLNLMRMAFAAAIEDGHCTVNPCDGIDAPEVPKPPFDFMQLEEQHTVERCQKIDEADRLRAMFAWGTGIRQYDQWVMKLTDLRLDLEDPDMIILCHKNGPRKPPRRIRVQLFGVALRALKRWLQLLPSYCPDNERGLVWPLPSGAQRQRSKSYGWREMLKEAGIRRRIVWHELRDTCASSLLMGWWGRAWTMAEVAGQLCQSDVETTTRYAHMAPSQLAEAARETTGHKLAKVARGVVRGIPNDSARRATPDSNRGPSAPEAHDVFNGRADLDLLRGQLVANARAVVASEASGDPRFARYALELAEAILDAASANSESDHQEELAGS